MTEDLALVLTTADNAYNLETKNWQKEIEYLPNNPYIVLLYQFKLRKTLIMTMTDNQSSAMSIYSDCVAQSFAVALYHNGTLINANS